jgi:hypothetical protein
MACSKCYHIIELMLELDLQDTNNNITKSEPSKHIGALIGIKDKQKGWRLATYIGNQILLVLFEKGKSVEREVFAKLSELKPLEKVKLFSVSSDAAKIFESKWLINIVGGIWEKESPWGEVEFYLYNVNIFGTSLSNKIKPDELLETIRLNLAHIEHLEEGDIVAFDRGWYQHHAVLTGKFNFSLLYNTYDLKRANTN